MNFAVNKYLAALAIAGCLTSCVSQKEVAYFQNAENEAPDQAIAITNRFTPTIQPTDILSIYVTSLNPEASSFFNPYAAVAQGTTITQMLQPGQIPTNIGYLVDTEGNVELPMLGKVKVSGLTTLQARDQVREKLKPYLKEPTVNIRMLNFKVSVMGEVVRPSMFTIPNEQITLPEALSLAGDITIFGRRDNVLIIRETNGKREFARINLNRRDLFSSPYYYLHPNDVVYVQPGKARTTSADRFFQTAPLLVSGLSFIAVILLNINR